MLKIKTNFDIPRDEFGQLSVTRLFQDLSANFKAISERLSSIFPEKREFSGNFTWSGSTQLLTLSHGFGNVASGFIVTNLTDGGQNVAISVFKNSETSDTITLKFVRSSSPGGTYITNYKIMILR